MNIRKSSWTIGLALLLAFSLACACPLSSLFRQEAATAIPAAAQMQSSATTAAPTRPPTETPSAAPTASPSPTEPILPTAAAFSFDNRWHHYLDLYELLDPRYDFGSTFSVQWESVNGLGEISESNGSEWMAVPYDEEQVALDFISPDTMNLWSITWPLNQPPGTRLLNPYDPAVAKSAPSAVLYLGDEFYAGQEGIIEFYESAPGTITAKMLLFLVSTDDPARDAVVMAFFNQLPLE
jgi:hypothetical protein